MFKFKVESCKLKKESMQQSFYKKHPDLIPDNPYLMLGRKVSADEFDKRLDKKILETIRPENIKEKLVRVKENICRKIKEK